MFQSMTQQKIEKWVTWPWSRPFASICHPKANTWYGLSVYKTL